MAEYKPSPSRPPSAAQPQNAWADIPNPNSGSTGARARLVESQPISLIPNVTNARLYTMCSRREVPANTPEMKQWDGRLTEAPMEAYLKKVRGGLDSVRGDQWGYQVAQQLPDAALNEVGGFLIGKVIGKLANALGFGGARGAKQVIDSSPRIDMPSLSVKPLSGKGNGVVILKKPPLRQAYIDEVNSLNSRVKEMIKNGSSKEEIAREMSQARRDIGVKYKDLTPPDMLEKIYQRNLDKYGDKLGPSVDWLRGRGKDWDAIIESATRTGGKDLGL